MPVTYKTMAVNVMKHVVTDDVSIYDKNSIFTLVSCLKKSLHVLPNIKIKAVINTGYIMTIEESHFSDSVSSTSNNWYPLLYWGTLHFFVCGCMMRKILPDLYKNSSVENMKRVMNKIWK